MKKTTTITIGGRPFTIEEDGYFLLKNYLEKIQNTFAKDELVHELVEDMEASISEKMQECLLKGISVITMDCVKRILEAMGQPEDIAEEGELPLNEPEEQKEEKQDMPKRLYRDTDNVVIAGVASGLAAYLGVDPVIIRLLFIILTFFNGIGILIYLALWIAVPKAETTFQKYEMRGKAFDFQEMQESIKEKSKHFTKEGKEAIERLAQKDSPVTNIIRSIGEGLVTIVRVFARIFLPIIGILIVLGSALGIAASITACFLFLIDPTIVTISAPFGAALLPATSPYFWIEIVSMLFVILIPLFFLLMLGATMIQRKNLFGMTVSSILMFIWILSLTLTATLFIGSIPYPISIYVQ